MDPRGPRSWRLADTIGPVFSHAGLRNWDLCLAREAIIARPRSLWITVKAGIWAGVGAHGRMQREWAGSTVPTGERELLDEGNPRWRQYATSELGSIAVRRCAGGANEIRIAPHGENPHVYGLGDRSQTDRCRAILARLYPGLYQEENFGE